MKREETLQALLNSIPMLTNRDWGSPEKNNRATELAQFIRSAINQSSNAEMERLVLEIKYFMSPTFVLSERMKRLIERHGQRAWRTPQDNTTWSGLMERTSIIVGRRDEKELLEIVQRVIAFLRQRNEHVLAQNIEGAVNMSKQRR